MWRRTYLLLILVRLYFALSPSYLHPDENFQGPEVIAGEIFSYPVERTWEFLSDKPIRSSLPLWPVYGLPMVLLRWVWSESGGKNDIAPVVVYWTLRALMFALSFVLEDWAIYELVSSPRQRRVAIVLVASSYVTWTYQTHTFSNSIETLLVLWSYVLVQRIVHNKYSTVFSASVLAFLGVFGVFNRITFPAFLVLPGLRLIPVLLRKPWSLLSAAISGLVTFLIAVAVDTSFYAPACAQPLTFTYLLKHPVLTPLNNAIYNLSTANLSEHGLHPHYQHLLLNLPQLLGPAYALIFLSISPSRTSWRLLGALAGIGFLSIFSHQEARFLIPAVPLILSSVRLPLSPRFQRVFFTGWFVFNLAMGTLMGKFHQGGVVPAQLFLANRADATTALWWKTYSPPIWLLDGKNEELTTHDLMGAPTDDLLARLSDAAPCHAQKAKAGKEGTYLVAPESATYLDSFVSSPAADPAATMYLDKVYTHRHHLNLDDLDFAEDGVGRTLGRVWGRRGLSVWQVSKRCS